VPEALSAFDRDARGALPSCAEDRSTARSEHKPHPLAPVVELSVARDERRLKDCEERLRAVVETNRTALGRLFQTGLIFTRAGARLGRDLLLAHQHLFQVMALLVRLGEGSPRRRAGRRSDPEVEAIFAQVQALLARTSELSARSDGLIARRK
jgi:hypothetical protein